MSTRKPLSKILQENAKGLEYWAAMTKEIDVKEKEPDEISHQPWAVEERHGSVYMVSEKARLKVTGGFFSLKEILAYAQDLADFMNTRKP